MTPWTRRDALTIHAAAAVAAGIAGGMAQLPGSHAPALVGVQTAMVMALAEQHDVRMHRAAVTDLVLTQLATMLGRQAAATMVAWVPGLGNAANAIAAAAVTEAVGWAAVRMFEGQGDAPR